MNDLLLAEEIVKGFFEMFPDMFQSFSDVYFENLTPETVLIMKVYCEFISNSKGREQAQELLPNISTFTKYLGHHLHILSGLNDESADKAQKEFLITQLFQIAKFLDFADEMGRRNLCSAISELIANEDIPDVQFESCIALLRKASQSDMDFICIISELISDLKEVFAAQSKEDLVKLQQDLQALNLNDTDLMNIKLKANLRALNITRFVLCGCSDIIQNSPILNGFLNELVLPSLGSPFALLQSVGLKCLGQACLMNKDIAIQYFSVFVSFFQHGGHESTRLDSLRIMFDVLMLFGPDTFNDSDPIQILLSTFEEGTPEILSVSVEGFAKLMFLDIVKDSKVNDFVLIK